MDFKKAAKMIIISLGSYKFIVIEIEDYTILNWFIYKFFQKYIKLYFYEIILNCNFVLLLWKIPKISNLFKIKIYHVMHRF